MKYGIIVPYPTISPTGGVKIQAEMWRDGFEMLGHECDLINPWNNPKWNAYDAIIMMGFGGSFRLWMKGLMWHNKKIAVAPIIDPTVNKYVYKFLVKYWGSQKYLGLSSRFHDLYLGTRNVRVFFTRSNEETEFLSYSCDIPKTQIYQVPLSVRFHPLEEMPQKENFCFHSSRLYAANKNVARLIEAAVKYNFPLYLGGVLNGKHEEEWLYQLIDGHDNIHYIGLVSDDELKDWYRRAKVFALPSLSEGVGMVALEAAGYGCEVVLTNVGAPKEYWGGRARLVDPKSVDDIGQAVLECLTDKHKKQPELMKFIKEEYSLKSCSQTIVEALKTLSD